MISNNVTVRLPLKPLQTGLLALLLLFVIDLQAQNDPLFSQYMFNKLAFNPAYAGSRYGLSIDALYRTQWTKLDGAPTDMMLTAHNVSNNDKYGYGGKYSAMRLAPSVSMACMAITHIVFIFAAIRWLWVYRAACHTTKLTGAR